MAEVVLSAFVSNLSGKSGDIIYFRHDGKLLQRSYVKPTNPKSPYQQAVRNSFGSLMQAWQTLTEEQRYSWIFAAAQIKLTNNIGVKFTPSGYNLFIRCNQNLFDCGLAMLPSFVSPTPIKSLYLPAAGVSYLSIYPSDSFKCKILFTGQTTASNVIYLIFASTGLSAGITNGKKYLRLFDTIPANTTDLYDCSGTYFPRFYPTPPVIYLPRVFFKLIPIDINSGFAGQPLNFQYLVT